MESRLQKVTPASLAKMLLALSGLYLAANFLGYIFIPANWIASKVILTIVILWLTINGTKNKENTTRANIVFTSLTPLIAFVYIAIGMLAPAIRGNGIALYAPLSGTFHAAVFLVTHLLRLFVQ